MNSQIHKVVSINQTVVPTGNSSVGSCNFISVFCYVQVHTIPDNSELMLRGTNEKADKCHFAHVYGLLLFHANCYKCYFFIGNERVHNFHMTPFQRAANNQRLDSNTSGRHLIFGTSTNITQIVIIERTAWHNIKHLQ